MLSSSRLMSYPDTPPSDDVTSHGAPIPTIDDFLKHTRLIDLKGGSPDLPTPPPELEVWEEKTVATPDVRNTVKALPNDHVPPRSRVVGLAQVVDPPVTWMETFRFALWSILLILTQAWRDFTSSTWHRPLLSTDFMTHYFFIPAGRTDPRLVTSNPGSRTTVRIIPSKATRQYEELDDLSVFPEKEIANFASNNYASFSTLEYDSERLMEEALRTLPFNPAPPALEKRVREECASFMGFDACVTAVSGFFTNILAFGTVAAVAKAQNRELVFLCDHESHNSMFTGAFYNKHAKIHRFAHNDLSDLEHKLRVYREQAPSALVCVAIEGLYSMEGGISPGPALLALKEIYGFSLLTDEAHSFMSLGSGGRGSFEHWRDLGYKCDFSKIDMMVCSLSKGVSCNGGFAVANGPFARELRAQGELLAARGAESLSTVLLLRFLSIINKPLLVQERMRLMSEKAKYTSDKLKEAGFRVVSSPGSPVVCFPVGTVRQVVLFHGEALKQGVAIVGGTPPATPFWGCRVRLCVFANTSWSDVHKLLETTISIAKKLKVYGVRSIEIPKDLLTRQDVSTPGAEKQARAVDAKLHKYIKTLKPRQSLVPYQKHGFEQEAIEAGVKGLKQYGLGPVSARWFYGSFDVFVNLERRLAKLYPSLVKQSGRCRALICSGAEIALGTSFSACVVPHASAKVHTLVLVDAAAPKCVHDGVNMRKAHRRMHLMNYTSPSDIPALVQAAPPAASYHLTIYLRTLVNGIPLNLAALFASLAQQPQSARIVSITVLLDDTAAMGKFGPRKLGYLDEMQHRHPAGGEDFLADAARPLPCPTRFMMAGSWYEAFGQSGGYLVGDAAVVEPLTWTSTGYFFSTSPLPLQAVMADTVLRRLSEKAI